MEAPSRLQNLLMRKAFWAAGSIHSSSEAFSLTSAPHIIGFHAGDMRFSYFAESRRVCRYDVQMPMPARCASVPHCRACHTASCLIRLTVPDAHCGGVLPGIVLKPFALNRSTVRTRKQSTFFGRARSRGPHFCAESQASLPVFQRVFLRGISFRVTNRRREPYGRYRVRPLAGNEYLERGWGRRHRRRTSLPTRSRADSEGPGWVPHRWWATARRMANG